MRRIVQKYRKRFNKVASGSKQPVVHYYYIRENSKEIWKQLLVKVKHSLKLFGFSLITVSLMLFLLVNTMAVSANAVPRGNPPNSNVDGRFQTVTTDRVDQVNGPLNLNGQIALFLNGAINLLNDSPRIIAARDLLIAVPALILRGSANNAPVEIRTNNNVPLNLYTNLLGTTGDLAVGGNMSVNRRITSNNGFGSYYTRKREGGIGRVQTISCLTAQHAMVSCQGRQINTSLANGIDPQYFNIFQGTNVVLNNGLLACNAYGHVAEIRRNQNNQRVFDMSIAQNNPRLEVSVICLDPRGEITGERNL